MSILFITQTAVNPLAGGVQRVTYTLGEEFRKRGYVVNYLAIGKKAAADVANQYSLPTPKHLLTTENLDYFRTLLKKQKVDIIINQVGIFPEINSFLKAAERNHAKLVNVHHNCVSCLNARYREIVLGNHPDSLIWRVIGKLPVWSVLRYFNKIKYGRYFQTAVDNADVLMLLSPSYIPELKQFGVRVSRDNVVALANPLSMQPPVALPGKENRILYVGRLSLTQKRMDKLMAIWKRLHEAFPDWSFDIVGEGEQKKVMEKFVLDNRMSNVHFHGMTDPRPFLEKAKFLTSTSDFEGYPMVLVEAQAYGVVPVAYHSFSAVTDLIDDGNTGFIVSDLSVDAYVDRMITIIKTVDEVRLEEMRNLMRKKVALTSADIIAQKWIDLIQKLNEAH